MLVLCSCENKKCKTMPFYAKSMPKKFKKFTFMLSVVLLVLLVAKFYCRGEIMTGTKTSTERSRKLQAKKKVQNPTTLSHMQMIDLKMKQRINDKFKEAISDPLYKRGLAEQQKPTFDPRLDGYCHIGPMDVECKRGCGAVFFEKEGIENTCCDATGHGSFETLQDLPDFMKEYLNDPEFRTKIRNYNCAFQIAHLGSSLEKPLKRSGILVHNKFPFHIRIHGQLYHSIPPVLPEKGANARFVQIYVIDNALEELCKESKNTDLDRDKMERILEYMNEKNPWARAIRHSVDQYMKNQPEVKTVVLDFVPNSGHQYRIPKDDIIAGFVPTNGDIKNFQPFRSVMLNNAKGSFYSIDELNVMYDPAHYVLMFLNGDPGYSPLVEKDNGEHKTINKFYQQRLHIRPKKHYPLGRFGRLFHQYVIDVYFKVENSKLQYIRRNNQRLRGTNSPGTRADDEPVGNDEGHAFVYLPRSFVSGPRYFRSKFYDRVNAVNKLGAGSLLITMTTNPDWPEIQENLAPGELAQDRPDIVARVFHMKWKQLKEDITKHHVLGFCLAHEDVHEFQKCGLPHGHMIVILGKQDQPRTPEDIDGIVCAEIPDQNVDREGFDLVTKHMLHGPYDKNKCLDEDNKCKRGFPFIFRETTVWHGDQRIQYRRRNDGRTFVGKKNFVFDNRYVVPYNMYLLKKYQCHLNVLVCSTKIAAVRYLFGYINKGVDMATIRASLLNDKDEIEFFVNGRYITAPEACHKLFGFELLNISPPTMNLPVHLEGRKWRCLGAVGGKRQSSEKPSKLEAFFMLNKTRLARGEKDELYYGNVSKYYVWDKNKAVWNERRQCKKKGKIGYSLNRIDNVKMKNRELFFLRMLLLRVPNPTCYEDLRTVAGCTYNTFEETCRALGLLTDDETWKLTMDEAVSIYHPSYVRSVFALILAYGEVSDPLKLYSDYARQMAEDFRQKHDSPAATFEDLRNVLDDIERHLNMMQMSLYDFQSMHRLLRKRNPGERHGSHIMQEFTYVKEEVDEYLASYNEKFDLANDEQGAALLKIIAAIGGINLQNEEKQRLFLINAAAGTGKTFVNGAIIDYVRYFYKTNIASVQVLTTAISAQLLPDAFTAHSTFHLPIRIDSDGTVCCGIGFDSKTAEMMKKAKLLIWDEALSARKELIEAVDRFFRELFNIDEPFGGLIIVLTGDNRQTLPKIMHG